MASISTLQQIRRVARWRCSKIGWLKSPATPYIWISKIWQELAEWHFFIRIWSNILKGTTSRVYKGFAISVNQPKLSSTNRLLRVPAKLLWKNHHCQHMCCIQGGHHYPCRSVSIVIVLRDRQHLVPKLTTFRTPIHSKWRWSVQRLETSLWALKAKPNAATHELKTRLGSSLTNFLIWKYLKQHCTSTCCKMTCQNIIELGWEVSSQLFRAIKQHIQDKQLNDQHNLQMGVSQNYTLQFMELWHRSCPIDGHRS